MNGKDAADCCSLGSCFGLPSPQGCDTPARPKLCRTRVQTFPWTIKTTTSSVAGVTPNAHAQGSGARARVDEGRRDAGTAHTRPDHSPPPRHPETITSCRKRRSRCSWPRRTAIWTSDYRAKQRESSARDCSSGGIVTRWHCVGRWGRASESAPRVFRPPVATFLAMWRLFEGARG